MFNTRLLMIVALLLGSPKLFAQNKCEDVLQNKSDSQARATVVKAKPEAVTPRSTGEAWQESVLSLSQINQSVYGRSQVIESLTTAMLAHEFVWINGEPGGAKTFLSRLMFQSALNAIPESDKKIFVLQFHKLISEGKISGFQK